MNYKTKSFSVVIEVLGKEYTLTANSPEELRKKSDIRAREILLTKAVDLELERDRLQDEIVKLRVQAEAIHHVDEVSNKF